MKLFGYDSAFMRFFMQLFHLTLANLIWILGCLPVVTAGASTAGLYYALDRLRLDDPAIWKNYRTGFKLHWKKATVGWLITAAFAAVLIYEQQLYDMEFFRGRTPLVVLLVIALTTLAFIAMWFFPILINFRGTFWDIVGNAFIFSFMYAPMTLVSLAMYAGLFLLISQVIYFAGLGILFGNAVIVYISLVLYERALRKYRKGAEED